MEEPFAPLATGERPKSFAAAYKLLMFVLHDVSAQAANDEELALQLCLPVWEFPQSWWFKKGNPKLPFRNSGVPFGKLT